MQSVIDQAKLKVRAWIETHKQNVIYDDEAATLLDIASGKSIKINWGDVANFEEKVHPETKDTYVLLLFENGNQLAVISPGGVAFAPSAANTGPLHDLPPVVCLQDFMTLKQRVDHYLYNHPDEPPPRECLDLMMICIATLDGARLVGFDVGDLEGELDRSLREIERRSS